MNSEGVIEEGTRFRIHTFYQSGLLSSPIDKYEDRKGLFDYEIEEAYFSFEAKLQGIAKVISKQRTSRADHNLIRALAGPRGHSNYLLKDCFVDNLMMSSGQNVEHRVSIAGRPEAVTVAVPYVGNLLKQGNEHWYKREETEEFQTQQTVNLLEIPSVSDLEKILLTKKGEANEN